MGSPDSEAIRYELLVREIVLEMDDLASDNDVCLPSSVTTARGSLAFKHMMACVHEVDVTPTEFKAVYSLGACARAINSHWDIGMYSDDDMGVVEGDAVLSNDNLSPGDQEFVARLNTIRDGKLNVLYGKITEKLGAEFCENVKAYVSGALEQNRISPGDNIWKRLGVAHQGYRNLAVYSEMPAEELDGGSRVAALHFLSLVDGIGDLGATMNKDFISVRNVLHEKFDAAVEMEDNAPQSPRGPVPPSPF